MSTNKQGTKRGTKKPRWVEAPAPTRTPNKPQIIAAKTQSWIENLPSLHGKSAAPCGVERPRRASSPSSNTLLAGLASRCATRSGFETSSKPALRTALRAVRDGDISPARTATGIERVHVDDIVNARSVAIEKAKHRLQVVLLKLQA